MAKNAGVDYDAWVDQAIAEYAEDLGVDPEELNERERLEAIEDRIDRLARRDPEPSRRAYDEDARPASRRAEEAPRRAEEAPRFAARAGDSPRRAERSRLDDALEQIEQRASRTRAVDTREQERGRLEEAIADIERRAERNEERTARALESLTGLVEARGVERSRLERAVEQIAQRAARNEERTNEALKSLQGLAASHSGERERLQEAVAKVEARAERNAERTARALETLTGLVEARKTERDRLEAAIERVGKRAEESEARTARALESLAAMKAPAPAPERPAPRVAAEGDDETFRLVAERLARRRKSRADEPEPAPPAVVETPPAPQSDAFDAALAEMQREMRRLAEKVETLSAPPPQQQALRAQAQEIQGALTAASDKAAAAEGAERQIAALADKLERLVGAAPAPAEMSKALKALAEAKAEIERNAPTAALQALERRIDELGGRIEAASRRPATDMRPFDDLGRRIEAIRSSLDRQSATRPDAVALSAALQALNDKLDRASTAGAQSAATMTTLQSMVARLEEALQRPTSVSLDARPIEDLARRIEVVRGAVERQGALAPKVDDLRAAVGELKQKVAEPNAAAAEIARLEAAIGQLGRQVEAALSRSATVDLKPVEDLARRVEAVRKIVERQGQPSAQVERLEEGLAEIRARLDRPAPHPQMEALDAALRSLTAKVEDFASRPAAVDAKPIEDLARRIEAVRSVAERGFAPHAARLETALSDIKAKLDKPELDGALRKFATRIEEAVSRPATVALDPKPLEDLARRIDTVKTVAERGFAPHAARLEAALGDLRAKVEDAASRPTTVTLDPKPIEDLARRIETVKNAAERGFAPHAARLEAALGDIRAKLDKPVAPEFDAAFRQLAAKLDEAMSRPATVALDPRPIEDLARRIESVRDSLEKPQTLGPQVERLETVLGEVTQKLERAAPIIDANGINSTLAAMNARLEEAFRRPAPFEIDNEPIEALAAQIEAVRETLERQAGQFDARRFEKTVLEAVGKLDRPSLGADDFAALISAVEELAAKVDQPAFDPSRIETLLHEALAKLDRPGASHDIAALAGAVEELSAKVDQPAPAFDASRLETLLHEALAKLDRPGASADMAALTEAVAELAHQTRTPGFDPSRLESRLAGIEVKLDRPAVTADDFDALMDAISGLAAPARDGERIEKLLEQIAARIDRPGVTADDFAALMDAVSDLAVRAGSPSDGGSPRVEALLQQIAARLDRPGVEAAHIATLAEAVAEFGDKLDRRATPNISLLEDLTRDISIRLDALETKIEDRAFDSRPSDDFVNLELAVRELAERMGDLRAPDTRSIEQEIRALHDKLDDVADSRMSGAFIEQAAQALAHDVGARISAASPDALLNAISDIHERLDVLGSARPVPAALEDAMRELTEEMEAMRAARDAADRSMAALTDLRAEQSQFDRRMDARFTGVQDILEKLVDRLGRLEREIVADAPPRPSAPEPRAPAQPSNRSALLDIPDRAASEIRAPGPEADPLAAEIAAQGRARDGGEMASAKTAARNAHIAAARRAANAAAVETERREQVDQTRKAAGAGAPSEGLTHRAQSLLKQHQRPVLLGAAGLLTILTGVAVLEWRGTHQPVRKSELDAPATPATPLASLPTSRDAMSAALDNTPTGSIASEPKVISAPIAPPAPVAPKVEAPKAVTPGKPPGALIAALPAGVSSALAAAGSNGDIGAEVEIAQRFLEGRTVPRDPKTAAGWLQAAADSGSVFAQYRLGALYEKGVGVDRNPAKARELYTKAAEAGNARAMHNLAVLYAQDGGAGKPDYAGAIDWFRKAAGYGVRDSQFNLGVLYGRGLGATQDLAQSWMWFSLAAKQGDVDAAKKRDEVANRMDGRVMAAAKKLLEEFKAKTPDPAVNDPPPVPAAAADDAPKAATSVKG